VEADLAGVLLGGLEETGLVSRGYDLWGEVEVRRVDEEPQGWREEISRVHAALPGSGMISLLELSRRAGVRPVAAQTALFKLMADEVVEALPRGVLVDIRLKKESLDAGSRGAMAARLKSRTRAAYDQIRGVETYATLETCRREHLLRHFGDTQEVAPCAGCDVCLGEADTAVATSTYATTTARTTAQDSSPAAMRVPDAVEVSNGATGTTPEAVDAGLFERLRAWRGDQARSQQVPAYVVLHNSHLEEIARRKPQSVHELGSVKGIGLRRAARYGEEILALVRGEEPASSQETDSTPPDYRHHLEAAKRLLRSGRGADAVPELARALEVGGEEVKKVVDDLLAP
jgi:ATP-dependent DNA helicase RecQ